MASSIETKIIDAIIDAETPDDNPHTPQDERAVVTNDPHDRGGRTQFGIAEKHNPQAWLDGKVTEAEARAIYTQKYLKPFKGLEQHCAFAQMVDFGVVSGPPLCIQKLQKLVGADVDGVVGPDTISRVMAVDHQWLNNQLVAERVKMIGRIVVRDKTQLRFILGWLNRALDFIK